MLKIKFYNQYYILQQTGTKYVNKVSPSSSSDIKLVGSRTIVITIKYTKLFFKQHQKLFSKFGIFEKAITGKCTLF